MVEENIPNIADMDTTLGIMQVTPDTTGTIPSLHPEAPQEMHFGENPEEEVEEVKETGPNQKELGYIRIEELIGSGKLSIETAEGLMLRIGAGEIEIVLKELQNL